MRSILLALLLVPAVSRACMNMIEPVPGVSIDLTESYELSEVHIDSGDLHDYINMMSVRCTKGLVRECSDLVVAYLYDKDFVSGLSLSTRLAAKFPDDYSVVITHAAALELNGKAAEAIPFMRHALELEPNSHFGSEWIHLRILEQRVRGGTPTPESLIGVDLRPSGKLTAPDTSDITALLSQVGYQVNDRLYFTPDDDPLFGALLFAYADLLELKKLHSVAKEIREMALDHGFAPATAKSSAGTVRTSAPTSGQHSFADILSWAVVGLLVICAFAFIWRNRKAE